MKVITFGRSSKNNFVVNDSKVSRVHCQIVQYDNGSFGVIDFGSANGTFVNGRRITGEVRLNWNDTVQIGDTRLQWQQYFGKKSNKAFGLVLGLISGVVVIALILILAFSGLFKNSKVWRHSDGNVRTYVPSIRTDKTNSTTTKKTHEQITDNKLNKGYTSNDIPVKPNVERLKEDLLGRKITEQPNGYHRQGWYWKIESGEIQRIEIRNVTENSNNYTLDVNLILQGESIQYEAFVIATYVLRQNEWVFDFLESKEINIVKTGKYNNCITWKKTGWSGEYQLDFFNHCDVALVVGGIIISEFGGEWQKFSVVVDANGTSHVGGLFFISVGNYQIDFIERPQ